MDALGLHLCGKFVGFDAVRQQLGAIDILVAGVLFSSQVVADYAVRAHRGCSASSSSPCSALRARAGR